MPKIKNSVGLVKRVPHFISKRRGMFTMERNERVDYFEKKILTKIFKNINSFDLRTYPTLDNIYLKLAKWLKVKEENLLLTEGADGGLLKIFSTYMEPNSRFLTLTPGFLMYPVYCSMFKSKCYEINLNENSQIPYGYKFPNLFRISVQYDRLDVGDYRSMPNMSIGLCYLSDIQVVYNPSGGGYHNNGRPNEVDMTLIFTEYRTLSKADVDKELSVLPTDDRGEGVFSI